MSNEFEPVIFPMDFPFQRRLREQRDTAWAELRAIREAINANPDESTLDEVRRLADKAHILTEANQRLGERVICGREAIPVKARMPGVSTAQLQAALSAVIEQRDELLKARQMLGAELAASRHQRDRLIAIIDQFSAGIRSEAQAAVAIAAKQPAHFDTENTKAAAVVSVAKIEDAPLAPGHCACHSPQQCHGGADGSICFYKSVQPERN